MLISRKNEHGAISEIHCHLCNEKWVVDESNLHIGDVYNAKCPLCNAELVRVVH